MPLFPLACTDTYVFIRYSYEEFDNLCFDFGTAGPLKEAHEQQLTNFLGIELDEDVCYSRFSQRKYCAHILLDRPYGKADRGRQTSTWPIQNRSSCKSVPKPVAYH